MKGEAFLIISVISLINGATLRYDTSDPSQAAAICAQDNTNSVLVAHKHCNKFYKCDHGKPVQFDCYGNLQFDPIRRVCDWPYTVECGDRIIPNEDCDPEEDNEVNGNGNSGNENNPNDNGSSTGNCDPSQAPLICAEEGSDGVLVAHENCNMYYKCNNRLPIAFKCPDNLLYNPSLQYCDWSYNVDCGDRVIPDPDCEEDDNNGSGAGSENNPNDGSDYGNCDPSEAPHICAKELSEGILVAHENCNQYYICNNGLPKPLTCPENLLFSPAKNICDWPENVDCGERIIPEPNNDDNDNDGSNNNDVGENNGNEGDGENNGSNDNNNEGSGSGVGCGCHDNPNEAPAVCSDVGSEGVLVAHENCNQFYICNGGRPVAQSCPSSLLYNPSTEQCDWPENVDCGDRVIPNPDNESNGNEGDSNDNGTGDDTGNPGNEEDSDNNGDSNGSGSGCGCHDKPDEAPAVCSDEGSEGVLVAHENCNQFYICNGGRPVAQSCPASLLYNPSIEQCDWPENVDCGDRVIPNPDNENNGNDGGSNDNGTGDNNGNPGNEGDNDNNEDSNGSGSGCGCHDNPNEAPAVCSDVGSEGVLVAHENCNQFYICNGGRPVAQSCPSSLLYNPSTEQCDWPENVDCGDRVIPNPDNEGNGNEGDSIDNGTGDDIGNPGNEEDSDNNGDSNGSGSGCGCHDKPDAAPAVCSDEGSEGVLVAHENCNQFYICNGGRPVAQSCPSSLLYNPSTEQCDWSENVDCGDRVIPNPDNENNGNEGGSNDNGTGDNNGNPGNDEDNDNNGDSNGSGSGCGCHDKPDEAPAVCSDVGSEGILVAHENCNQFYICNGGRPVALSCPASLLYNPSTEQCDWPENVDCGDRVIPNPDNENNGNEGGSNDNGTGDNNGNGADEGNNGVGNDNGNGNGCNDNPAEAPAICAVDGSEGVLVAHENCNQFYICNGGRPVAQSCPASLLYNPSTEQCDWLENVDCGDRVIPNPDNENNGNEGGSNDNGTGDDIGNPGNEEGSDNNGDSNGSGSGCGCHDKPDEAPAVCSDEGSEGVLVAHEICNQFYICDSGRPVAQSCPASLLYNPSTEQCDWPENVDCGDRVIPNPDNENNGNEGGSNDNGTGDNNGNPGNDGDNDNNEDNNGSGSGCGCHDKPDEAPAVCSDVGSEGVLVAHENCNQFYICNGGKPVAQFCPSSLLYNPSTEQCDWPENVDCGDRVIPNPDNESNGNEGDSIDNGTGDDIGNPGNEEDSDNNGDSNGSGSGCGCHDKPDEAPAVCSDEGSEGVLVAHENCNQFYICNGGRPVAQSCPSSLLYNPSTEQCDWPENVDCGDRVIPNPDNESNGNEGDSNDNGTGDDTGNPGNEEDSDNNGDSNGSGSGCGCHDKPDEAPAVCSDEGSEGVLVAHENCNQFYICNGGRPVAQSCPASLLYNPSIEQCDWPENVDCGDRVIPNPDNENNGNDGGSNDNGTGDNNGNPGNEGDNDNNEDSNGSGSGCGCHDNPNEAPAVCSDVGSEGVLVAHENCNQFYICNGGRPVAQSCPSSLLYNPSTEQCDWPENVDCGDRVIPNPDNESNGNEGDSIDNGTGDDIGNPGNEEDSDNNGDSNGSGSGCGCHDKPDEAPAVCSDEGSEGVLVAHENCNQFYICNSGRPVAQSCPSSLLYNPSTEQCDWPENVDCGDRVIPNPDNESNGNDGDSNENGTGDDIGNPGNDGDNDNNEDNNGSGSGCGCHDKPDEAPAVCSDVGSEGVLVAHENCNQFYICNGGKPVAQSCPYSLLYNPSTEQCDWPENVDCGDRVISNPDNESNGNEGDSNDNGTEDDNGNPGNEGDNDNNGDSNGSGSGCGCHDKPDEAPAVCSDEGSEGVLVAHENCNQFYICNGGRPVAQSCPASLLYNPSTEQCDWPENVDCGDRVIPNPDNESNGNNGDSNDNGTGDDIGNPGNEGDNDNNGDSNGSGSGCGCHDKPDEAPAVCSDEGSEGVLVAHENCNQFYICNGGRPVAQSCPASLLYNPSTEQCDWPENVDCGDRIIPNPDNENNGNEGGSNDNATGDSNGDPGNDGANDNNGDSNGSGSGCGCHDKPDEAPAVCSDVGSEGVLVAHENCNQFYVCNGGRPVTQSCPSSLLYNPSTEQCDWPVNVDCGDRVIPNPDIGNNGNEGGSNDNGTGDNNENTGNDGVNDNNGDNNGSGSGCGCHDNPAEAPAICALDGSEGVLVAHENCNQFYVCNGGSPVVQSCPASLLYNPSTEQCDWPDNVVCSDRVIPDPDCEENDNNSNDNDSYGNANQGVGGGCNDNPAEAPAICASDGSDGVQVAHENCNQFYVCNGGRPVTLDCPSNLLYDPVTELCDWADSVNCGNRTRPDNNQEDCDDNDTESGSETEEDPFGHEAQEVCALPGSDGKYLPHKNCNQFHVCIGGVPNVLTCPATLLYEVALHICLWPESVNCGNRITEINN